jgi:hypothetical protein
MARDLGFLPGGELGVERLELMIRLGGEPGHLVGNIDVTRRGDAPQLLDLTFEFGDGFFKVQKLTHAWGV